ncbi:MAG: hypothetical protein AABY22_23255, partial [Nanoarchaeota archaeon]
MNKKILVTLFTSIVLFGVLVSAGLIQDIGDGIGDLINGKEPTNSIKQIIYDSPNSEIIETSNGFIKRFYQSQVNIEYNNKFIPIEEFLNVSEESGNLKIEDLTGRKCIIKLNYTLTNKLDIATNSFNITKNRGHYYFTSDVENSVDSMNYIFNCSGYDLNYDTKNDDLQIGDFKIDFTDAKLLQNISTTYNETIGQLEFKPLAGKTADLSFIDPFVGAYNYSVSTNSFAKGCTNGGTSAPPSDTLFACTGTLADLTASQLASSDNTRAQTTQDSTNDPYQMFYFNFSNLVSNKSDITSINLSWEGSVTSVSGTVYFYGYWYNASSSSWLNMFKAVASTTDTTYQNKTISGLTDFINDSNFFHSLIYWDSGVDVSDSLRTDYVFLEVNYDGIIINSPTDNLEVLNSLSTTLNVSSSSYDNIWWTSNGGRINTTLCTNCNSPNWTTINFKRQGYYNISVYANKSDSSLIQKNVTNIFVGNLTVFLNNSIQDTYIRGQNQDTENDGGDTFLNIGAGTLEYLTLLKTNLTTLASSNITIHTAFLSLFVSTDEPATLRGSEIHDMLVTWNEGNGTGDINNITINGSTSYERWFEDNVNDGNTPFNSNDPDWQGTPTCQFDDDYNNCTLSRNGDYNSTTLDSKNIGLTNNIWYTYNITKSRQWNNLSNELGWLIFATPQNSYGWSFDSSESTKSPYVNLTYYSNNIAPTITHILPNSTNFSTVAKIGLSVNITDDNDFATNASLYLYGAIIKTTNNPCLGIA